MNKQGQAILIIFIFAVLLAGVGAYFLYSHYADKTNEQIENSNTEIKQVSEDLTQTVQTMNEGQQITPDMIASLNNLSQRLNNIPIVPVRHSGGGSSSPTSGY